MHPYRQKHRQALAGKAHADRVRAAWLVLALTDKACRCKIFSPTGAYPGMCRFIVGGTGYSVSFTKRHACRTKAVVSVSSALLIPFVALAQYAI